MNMNSLWEKIRLGLKYKRTATNVVLDHFKRKVSRDYVVPFPRYVGIHLTNKCNLRCPMCSISTFRDAKNESDAPPPPEVVEAIMPELKKYKPLIYFTGGEVTLLPDIQDIIHTYSKERLFTGLTTNGLLLEKISEKIIASGLELISISLDHYTPEVHDKIRGMPGVFNKTIRGIRKLLSLRKSLPSSIKVHSVICRENYDSLSRMYDFVESLGVDGWTLGDYQFTNPQARAIVESFRKKRGITDLFEMGDLLEEEGLLTREQVDKLVEQLADINRKSKRYRTSFLGGRTKDLYSYYMGKMLSKRSSCNSPFEVVKVMQYNILSCMKIKIGNLKEHGMSLKVIWDSQKMKDFHADFQKHVILPPCFRCCGITARFD